MLTHDEGHNKFTCRLDSCGKTFTQLGNMKVSLTQGLCFCLSTLISLTRTSLTKINSTRQPSTVSRSGSRRSARDPPTLQIVICGSTLRNTTRIATRVSKDGGRTVVSQQAGETPWSVFLLSPMRVATCEVGVLISLFQSMALVMARMGIM
jgi:hypothetical protein